MLSTFFIAVDTQSSSECFRRLFITVRFKTNTEALHVKLTTNNKKLPTMVKCWRCSCLYVSASSRRKFPLRSSGTRVEAQSRPPSDRVRVHEAGRNYITWRQVCTWAHRRLPHGLTELRQVGGESNILLFAPLYVFRRPFFLCDNFSAQIASISNTSLF